MTDIKLMFWNIQNVYEYKTVTPEELQLEATISGDAQTQEIKTLRRSQRIYDNQLVHHRQTVVSLIQYQNPQPDLVAIVELSVGKADLLAKGKVEGPAIWAEHYGIEQYMVSLNEPNVVWQSVQSPVNAIDMFVKLDTERRINTLKHKNSMFELYGILWRNDKLVVLNEFGSEPDVTPKIKILSKAADGTPLNFKERAPGWIVFGCPQTGKRFVLIMNHSVFGDDMGARQSAIAEIARSDVIACAVKQKIPVVVAGDFNLDYQNGTYYEQLTKLGMIARIGDQKSTRVYQRAEDLSNAYDQIFTHGFSNEVNGPGVVWNFAADPAVFGGNYTLASRISDHLPAIVTVRL